MAGLPNFSQQDRKSLKKLGVVEAQIEQLRYARLTVRLSVSQPAARNDIADLLNDVAIMAESLLRKTGAISAQSTAAHAVAHSLIEQGYWNTIPDDSGGQSFHCLAPRLRALRDAASKGKDELSPRPSRYRSANPQPVHSIAEALVFGWSKEHGSNVYKSQLVDGKEVMTYCNGPQRKPYPDTLTPSAADGSAFRKIVGICYEAEGGNSDPLAAIKAYLRKERESREEAMAALEAGLASANRKTRNRTSRKISGSKPDSSQLA